MFRLPNYKAMAVSNYGEIHYMELLNDSQKQENIEELKNLYLKIGRYICILYIFTFRTLTMKNIVCLYINIRD